MLGYVGILKMVRIIRCWYQRLASSLTFCGSLPELQCVGGLRIMFALDSGLASLPVYKEAPGKTGHLTTPVVPVLLHLTNTIKHAYWTAVHTKCSSNTRCLVKGIDLS
jgi:hypothetical protein